MNNNYYYTQGFKVANNKSSIQFILSLKENKIEGGSRVIVYYKSGATTNDFADILPQGISIDSDKTILTKYHKNLSPKRLKFNDHELNVYDLDSRVINYVVAEDSESAIFEDEYHTTWVINKSLADDFTQLELSLKSSKYVCWQSIPVNEYYSYRYANTANAGDLDPGLGNETSGSGDIPSIINNNNTPIIIAQYSKWRLEFAQSLVGFYEQLGSQLPEFDIYMNGDKIKCLDKIGPNRIDIYLDNLANLHRRPFIYRHDLYQSHATLSVRVSTDDMLKYMHLKKKFQNVELISTITEYNVLDKLQLPWLTHVWWEQFQDSTQLKNAKDNEGRLSYVLELRCTLHFYEVEDEMMSTIDLIRVCFQNLPGKPEYIINIEQET